jgi:hypothetical protein
MKPFIITSYVTKDTPYEEVVEQYLRPSLEKFKLVHYIETVPDLGDWYQNTAYKPAFLLKMLHMFKEHDIVFLDADATVEQYPTLFNEIPDEYSLALHYLEWKTWYNQPTVSTVETLSGTLYLRNTSRIVDMLSIWSQESVLTRMWEQKVLQRVLGDFFDIKVYHLPLDYCYIKTLPQGQEPYVKIEHPVIAHHQVSRQLKRRKEWKNIKITK